MTQSSHNTFGSSRTYQQPTPVASTLNRETYAVAAACLLVFAFVVWYIMADPFGIRPEQVKYEDIKSNVPSQVQPPASGGNFTG